MRIQMSMKLRLREMKNKMGMQMMTEDVNKDDEVDLNLGKHICGIIS